MNKKEYCMNHETIGVIDEFGGFEVKGYEYGNDDYMYCVSGANSTNELGRSYHKLKLHSNKYGFYVKLYDRNIYLSDIIKANIGGN